MLRDYPHLRNLTTPRHLAVAVSLLGTKEVVGARNSPVIIGWANELGLQSIYRNDSTPWCSLFVYYSLFKAQREIPATNDRWNYLRAMWWLNYGILADKPALGDLLVFRRQGGGHVGFYVGEDATTYHVLGGNQSNEVNIMRLEKNRFVAARRPIYTNFTPKAVIVRGGGNVSQNEA